MSAPQRLKVLFITGWYPSPHNPLAGVFVREHAKAVRLYNDVAVLHLAGADSSLKKVHRLVKETDPALSENIPTYHAYFKPLPIPHTSFLAYYWGIFQAYRQIIASGFKPDIIHAHIYYAGFAAVLLGKLTGTPVVITEHSSAFPRKLLSRMAVWQARFAFKHARVVMPVSMALQKAIENYGIQARFQIVPNVVDTNIFFLSDKPQRNNIKQLLFVGSLIPVKGMPYLLNALAKLRKERQDWHLNVVGDGPLRAEYEQQAVDLGIDDKVTFHGAKSKIEVAEFMRKADIFVLPSLYETFSVVSIEALASGLLVLATYSGGPETFITDEVGILVPPGDIEALRTGISKMLDNLDGYSKQQIYEYAKKKFSPEVIGAQLHTVYQSVTVSNCR